MNRIKLAGNPVLLAVLGLVLTLGALMPVTEAAAQGEPYLELLRQDLQTDKVAIMTQALELTEEQGAVFWPNSLSASARRLPSSSRKPGLRGSGRITDRGSINPTSRMDDTICLNLRVVPPLWRRLRLVSGR